MMNPALNNSTKNTQPNQMNLEAMQHLFMQSPLFQHFQKQFLMSQQLFAQQQQHFLLQAQQKNLNEQQKSNGHQVKSNVSPAQKRNKLSIDEILKQRVKPVAVEQEDNPTDTSGSNGIGEEDEGGSDGMVNRVKSESNEIKME
jgi:hypothetical protein